MFIYDATARSLRRNLRLPPATDTNGKPSHQHADHQMLRSPDGRMLYHLVSHGIRSVDLRVVDLEQQAVAKTVEGVPGGIMPVRNAVVDGHGKIVYPALVGDAGRRDPGLASIDPRSGAVETASCQGSNSNESLHSPSPDGRHWLRSDNSRLPHVTQQGEDYFSFGLEIWEAHPLRIVAVAAPMWMTAYELPDEGHLDMNAWKEGRPARRGEIYRKLSNFLKENPQSTWRNLSHKNADLLWPEEKSFYANVSSNLHKFGFGENDMIGWQPDGQAFWVQKNNFVACIGVDGKHSPKLRFERFGMRTGTWLPCAANFKSATPRDGRRLEMLFDNEIAIADGTAQAATTAIRIISRLDDECRPIAADGSAEADVKLAQKAEELAKKRSVYRVDLAAMDEAGCVAAIDALTAQIGPDINQRPHDNKLRAEFLDGRKKLDEKTFFAHVEQTCLAAAPATARLLEAVCENLNPLIGAYYEPYYSEDTAVGAFGYAARALAVLDRGSNALLLRYGALIDTDHENFFLSETLPLMLRNEGDEGKRLELAETYFIGRLGNAADPYPFWKSTGMEKLASGRFSPQDYAGRLLRLARDRGLGENPKGDFGCYLLDWLGRDMEKGPSPWEAALLKELRGAVATRRA
ncbi:MULTISPECIES: hypothetical protein [unclassified Mesorhizobium]|uniref:hypothetical protein n=1 Tax=unclassified Mesorhizobium TaxID=325217 RepID=UPI00112766F5|nr:MULTISPECIES: hypothetical protein [unclassified Mesorhizobium]TPK96267.1 hypothetical protein FJ567_21735 [Mesorhizobium sp. B2-4-16]TPL62305.1 hypothetical protein FJ956_25845 [Mesorhizobium sp. B2-4-3]